MRERERERYREREGGRERGRERGGKKEREPDIARERGDIERIYKKKG